MKHMCSNCEIFNVSQTRVLKFMTAAQVSSIIIRCSFAVPLLHAESIKTKIRLINVFLLFG